jgi:hypothetical protein
MPETPRRGMLRAIAASGIGACAEAMFPPNTLGAPDWRAARVVERTFEHMADLPPAQGRQILALFILVELAAPLLGAGPRRFSRLAPQRRESAIRRWRASRLPLLRLVGEGIKMSLTMMYLSHPDVARYLGEDRQCAQPPQALPLAPAAQPGAAP